MKVVICGKNKGNIEELVRQNGFEIVESNPEFVISYGGDGTLMWCETQFPGVPKILLKDSSVCKKCSSYANEEVLKKVQSKKYTIEQLAKVEVDFNGKKLLGMNEVIVHNQNPRHGIRYNLSINGKPFGREVIGDGIVVATPFGSTGYYRSITDSFFEVGLGLAFNNSTEPADHMVLKDDAVIELSLTRGPAEIFADNHSEQISLEAGQTVRIKKSDLFARIVSPI